MFSEDFAFISTIPYYIQQESESIGNTSAAAEGGGGRGGDGYREEEEERGVLAGERERGGGMVSAHWVWSGQGEECVCTPAESPGIDGVSVYEDSPALRITCQNREKIHCEYACISLIFFGAGTSAVLCYCEVAGEEKRS